MTEDEIAREARRRQASHDQHASNRTLRRDQDGVYANKIGLRGEAAFAEAFGMVVDLTPRPGGDGGQDFVITLGIDRRHPVDCKTANTPKELIVEVERRGKPVCKPDTIYVLCGYNPEQDRARLLGWQWGHVLLTSWPKSHGYGVLNYWCSRRELRSIDELHRLALTPRGQMLLAEDDRNRPKPFSGVCLVCGQPGMYVGWFCEDHRVW